MVLLNPFLFSLHLLKADLHEVTHRCWRRVQYREARTRGSPRLASRHAYRRSTFKTTANMIANGSGASGSNHPNQSGVLMTETIGTISDRDMAAARAAQAAATIIGATLHKRFS